MRPTLEYFKSVVNNVCGLNINDNTRQRDYIYARTMYYGLARKYTFYSLKVIGESVGRDHATVLHALRNLDRDVIKNEDRHWNQRWEYACHLISSTGNTTYIVEDDETVVGKIHMLTKQNKYLLDVVKELSGVSMPEEEKRLLEAFRMLNNEDKMFLILKAETTLKFIQQEEKKKKELEQIQINKQKNGFNSYLADAKV